MNTEAARLYARTRLFQSSWEWQEYAPWEVHPDCRGPECSLWDAHHAARPVRLCEYYGSKNPDIKDTAEVKANDRD